MAKEKYTDGDYLIGPNRTHQVVMHTAVPPNVLPSMSRNNIPPNNRELMSMELDEPFVPRWNVVVSKTPRSIIDDLNFALNRLKLNENESLAVYDRLRQLRVELSEATAIPAEPADVKQPGKDEDIEEDNDPVNHPSHYTAYEGLEIIDLVEQMNFNRGNAVKYIARAGLKNPETEVQDLKKGVWYLEREIERIEK
jgi:hypothetical protein